MDEPDILFLGSERLLVGWFHVQIIKLCRPWVTFVSVHVALGLLLNILNVYYEKLRNYLNWTGRFLTKSIEPWKVATQERMRSTEGSQWAKKPEEWKKPSMINATILVRVTLHKTVESFWCCFSLCLCVLSQRIKKQGHLPLVHVASTCPWTLPGMEWFKGQFL